jgi:hypothetical protein
LAIKSESSCLLRGYPTTTSAKTLTENLLHKYSDERISLISCYSDL